MALHAAARDGNLEELQKLIAAKQDLNERDKHHRTPLVMASWAGKVSLRLEATVKYSFEFHACICHIVRS